MATKTCLVYAERHLGLLLEKQLGRTGVAVMHTDDLAQAFSQLLDTSPGLIVIGPSMPGEGDLRALARVEGVKVLSTEDFQNS